MQLHILTGVIFIVFIFLLLLGLLFPDPQFILLIVGLALILVICQTIAVLKDNEKDTDSDYIDIPN